MKIEGVPDGWELVRIGRPRTNEWSIGGDGTPWQYLKETQSEEFWPIIRKAAPPCVWQHGVFNDGWRVAEAMREVANDAVGGFPIQRSLFSVHDRVRVKCGRDRGHYGTITHVGGDDGTYYGVKLDCHDSEMGFSEYELEQANPDEPA